MTKKKSKLPTNLTTVTRISKTLALILFFMLPIIGMYIGYEYGKLQCLFIY